MTEPTKIDFHHRRIQRLDDITDLVEILFPGNRNQQHAAARILLALKSSSAELIPSLTFLEKQHNISRRTLQRTRAKLSRLGLIERITWTNSRYGGQEGWKLSSRFGTALRRLAETCDAWRKDTDSERVRKDEMLVGLLHP